MRFVDPVEQVFEEASLEPILGRIDGLFDEGWRSRQSEIAGCLCAMRQEHRAFRALFARFADGSSEPKLQGAQSFLIADNHRFGIRVNLWFPRSNLEAISPRYRKYLSIDELHNHDFDFFTLRLSGPGYRSRFYRDKNFSPYRASGDSLALEPLGEVALEGQAVMFVEHSTDYHAQQWPSSFTTTLNLIPKDPPAVRVQYVVEEESFLIRDVVRHADSLEKN